MGTVASALEVVPLTLMGFEVVKSLNISRYCGSLGEKNC